jgi:F-box-like
MLVSPTPLSSPNMSRFLITTGARRASGDAGEAPKLYVRICTLNCESVNHIVKKPLPLEHSPISVLNDDVLLHIFYIYRLHSIRDKSDKYVFGYPFSDEQRWWYKLVHVSRRWRRVILDAPSLLDLHLVCTRGVPVADMLAHSPPLPLTIVYWLRGPSRGKLGKEEENGALLALSHRDRVRRIALDMSLQELKKLFVAMDGEFPILERLNIDSSLPGVTLPREFRAPNLYHGDLMHVSLPVQCPLLTSTGLVSLQLRDIPRSVYYPPSYILASLSQMSQLETLWIKFQYPDPRHDIRDTATTSHATLPNLREFEFWGVSAYLEGLCAWMTAPVLSFFSVHFFNQLTSPIPCLLSFMQTSQNLQIRAVVLDCGMDYVSVGLCATQLTAQNVAHWKKYRFNLGILRMDLDSPILCAIRIFDTFSPVLSLVEQVTLIVDGDELEVSQQHDEVDRTLCPRLHRIFRNVTKLRVAMEQVRGQGLGNLLCTKDGDLPLELLPNLEEVSYSGSDDENAFGPFINEREALDRPVRLTLQSW